MTDADYATFDRAFRRVCGVFRLKLKDAELEDLTRTYFKILDQAPLDDVLEAGKRAIATSKTFPKPVDWLAALPVPIVEARDYRVMREDEREDYARAERLHFAGDPCGCLLCQAAGTDRPLRFVPTEVDETGRLERAVDSVRNRVLVVGHWAHGAELVAWYAAKARCFASVPRSMPKLLLAMAALVEREPGEEG